MKTCNKCNEEKELMLFAKGKKYKDGRRNVCKKCHTAYVISYYNSNPDKKAAKNKMNTFYRPAYLRHNLTKEEYEELFNLHNGKCHSCKERDGKCIDHDHSCCGGSFSCGKCVRGLLCSQCNTALGSLGDSKEKIKGLLEYIK
jgi:hypothetical protein